MSFVRANGSGAAVAQRSSIFGSLGDKKGTENEQSLSCPCRCPSNATPRTPVPRRVLAPVAVVSRLAASASVCVRACRLVSGCSSLVVVPARARGRAARARGLCRWRVALVGRSGRLVALASASGPVRSAGCFRGAGTKLTVRPVTDKFSVLPFNRHSACPRALAEHHIGRRTWDAAEKRVRGTPLSAPTDGHPWPPKGNGSLRRAGHVQ